MLQIIQRLSIVRKSEIKAINIVAKDHSDLRENLNDEPRESQPESSRNTSNQSPSVEPTAQNPDQAPRQQKRAAKRAAVRPKTVANVQSTSADTLGAAVTLSAEDLDDRKIQGMLLAVLVKQKPANCIVVDSGKTMYVSSNDETMKRGCIPLTVKNGTCAAR